MTQSREQQQLPRDAETVKLGYIAMVEAAIPLAQAALVTHNGSAVMSVEGIISQRQAQAREAVQVAPVEPTAYPMPGFNQAVETPLVSQQNNYELAG